LSNKRIGEQPQFYSNFKEQNFNVSFGYNLSEKTKLGFGINYIYSRRENLFNPEDDDYITAKNFSLDLGILHEINKEFENFSISSSMGWSLTDFGPTFTFSNSNGQGTNGESIRYGLPMVMRAGLSLTFSVNKRWVNRRYGKIKLLGSLSKGMARTDDEGDPHGPFRSLFSSWDSYSRSDGQNIQLGDQIQRHQGIELSFFDIFFGRLGYIHRPSKRFGYNISSLGFGLDLYYLSVDYARIKPKPNEIVNVFEDRSVWQITGRIPIGNTNHRNFWPVLLKAL